MEEDQSPLEVLSLVKLRNTQAARNLRVPQSQLPLRPVPIHKRLLPPLKLKQLPKKHQSQCGLAISGYAFRCERSLGPIIPRQRSDAQFYYHKPHNSNSVDFEALQQSLQLNMRANSSFFFREYTQEPKEHVSFYLPARSQVH